MNTEHILSSFKSMDGNVRVLIATVAFGMGVDCKGLHYVIHFGPPSNLDSYLQESSRAGSLSVLTLFPRCFSMLTTQMIVEESFY